MSRYVIVEPDGTEIPCNTPQQVNEAAQRLYDLGVMRARVMTGVPPDRVATNLYVYSEDTRSRGGRQV